MKWLHKQVAKFTVIAQPELTIHEIKEVDTSNCKLPSEVNILLDLSVMLAKNNKCRIDNSMWITCD